MRIPLLTLGSRGDVQPFAQLARTLQTRGHDVLLGAPANAAHLAASLNIPFVPIADDFEALTRSPDARLALRGNLRAMRRLQRATLGMTERMLYRAADAMLGADAVVYHQKIIHGPDLARRNGIPGFRAMALPALVPTSAFPIPLLPLPNWPLTNALTYRIPALGMLAYRGILRKWRARYPPLHEVAVDVPPPATTLYAFSPSLVERPADWSAGVHVTGYWHARHPEAPALDPALESFLQAGAPPVYIGFGSMVPTDVSTLSQNLLHAIQSVGCRAILHRGWAKLGAGITLPQNILAIDGAPHDALFPRCRAVVHHGGAGTTHAGLRHGRPTLICPFFADQPFWGARVAALGCGPVPLSQKRGSAGRFAERLQDLISNSSYAKHAEVMAKRLAAEDGIGLAADLVERTVRLSTQG